MLSILIIIVSTIPMTMTTILMIITEDHINDGVIVKIITIVIKNIKKRKIRRRIKYDKQVFPHK